VPSKNGKAAQRAQLNEEDMESWKAPGRSGGSTRVGDAGRQKKKRLGSPRKSLIRLDSDKEIKVNGFDSLWRGLAGFGSIRLNLDSAWIFPGCYSLHIGATDLTLGSPSAGAKQEPRTMRALENAPIAKNASLGVTRWRSKCPQGSRRFAF
jgi:hypothetical protein